MKNSDNFGPPPFGAPPFGPPTHWAPCENRLLGPATTETNIDWPDQDRIIIVIIIIIIIKI